VIFFNLTQEEKRQNTAYKNFIQNVIKDTNVLSQVMSFFQIKENYIMLSVIIIHITMLFLYVIFQVIIKHTNNKEVFFFTFYDPRAS